MQRVFVLLSLVVTVFCAGEAARASVISTPRQVTEIDKLLVDGANTPQDKTPNLRKSFKHDGNLAGALSVNSSTSSMNPASNFSAIAITIPPITGSAPTEFVVGIPPSPIDEFFSPPETPVSCLY